MNRFALTIGQIRELSKSWRYARFNDGKLEVSNDLARKKKWEQGALPEKTADFNRVNINVISLYSLQVIDLQMPDMSLQRF